MTLEEKISEYKNKYDVISLIDLDQWHTLKIYQQESWLRDTLQAVHRDEYQKDQRIVFTLTGSDNSATILKNLQYWLFRIDITCFFVVLLTDDPNIKQHWETEKDPTLITFDFYEDADKTKSVAGYQYNSTDLVKKPMSDLTKNEHDLLTTSKTFCIYPWIHLHAYPTGAAYPCCHSEMKYSIGDTRTNTLKEIWNGPAQRQLRLDMLSDTQNPACNKCYEQEESGFFSGRRSANKHHGHLIDRVHATQADGTVDRFEMTYWDIRFSNLCNLKCRSCGHIFSSQWYQDQVKLAGPTWKAQNPVLNYAGRTETDMWEQLIPHLDYVEQIYFAGGEPLLMEEHYNILEELVRRKRFDVRLIYNTNFTHTDLKGRSVFEYWKKVESVAVGASLDAMGPAAEYIRKGTRWADVVHNREQMINTCPQVDFYISPTLSIMNARHLPEFHRNWVEKGLIRAQDLNVNILQDPSHYRIDIAPEEYKEKLSAIYSNHLTWLREQGDTLGRATKGFESAITFMNATDNTQLIDTFWRKTHELDSIRNENILDVLPELQALK
jgi:radical SAM protein with 4Fe4S-binding SPASM domain